MRAQMLVGRVYGHWLPRLAAAMFLVISLPAPVSAAPQNCAGYVTADIEAMTLADAQDWLTKEIELCAKPSAQTAADYTNRGLVNALLGDYEAAIADYEQAIAYNPNDPNTWNNRGVLYRNLGRFDAAIADFDKAIELEPNFSSAYGNRALTYGLLGDSESAIPDFLALFRLNGSIVPAWQELLAQGGFYEGPINGVVDEAMEAALRGWIEAGMP